MVINKDELRLFLEKKKSQIEKKSFFGIGEMISGISLILTLLSSDFEKVSLIPPSVFKFIGWTIAIAILAFGTYQLIHCNKNKLTIEHLYNEIVELSAKKEHVFNIVALKNNAENGKYLVFKNTRWSCYLFPNYAAASIPYDKSKEINNVLKCVSDSIGVNEDDITITYLGDNISEKFSYGDKITKKYHFHFYSVKASLPGKKQIKPFKYNGKKFAWLTLDSMYKNKNIVKKNNDVLDFIRKHQNIS